jgi:MFS family permease
VLTHSAQHKRQLRRLIGIFAALYFVQGTCEPTDGLVSQPLRSMLIDEGATPGQVAEFLAIVALPWLLKPLYGPVVDLVPLFGQRRRSWLLVATALATVGLTWLSMSSSAMTPGWALGAVLVMPTFAIALGDVATDALMVETGQPLGVTGALQSAQWTASYGATIAIGWLVGWLTEIGHGQLAFAIAAGLSGASFLVVFFIVKEPPPPSDPPEPTSVRGAIQSALSWRVLRAALFLFLLGFNPFAALEYAHITIDLGLSDAHYGQAVSVVAIGAVIACLAYGWVAEHVEVKKIAHVSLGSSVVVTLGLFLIHDEMSDFALSIATALAWTFAFLLQLDIAARLCPPRYAATVFAMLMGVSNGADSISAIVGGELHDWLSPRIGAVDAYHVLVVMGAAATAGAWAMVPWLARDHALAVAEEEADTAPGATS